MISRYRSCGESVTTAAAKFGGLVRSARRAKGLKVWEVAERVDIDAKHLGRIERGEKQPSFDLIMALARVLNVSPASFFDFDLGEPTTLRKQIELLLKDRSPGELQRAREVLKNVFVS